jgi:hypothetical protein
MGYRYVQAEYDYGPRRGAPVLAFVIHMAEGGGTVGYLAKPNPNKVSVHYVVERSGRVVQMLGEDRVSGSINPRDIRTSNGPHPYGAETRRLVMGAWDADPNRAIITVEVEGYARAGPDPIQATALRKLVEDVRSRFPRIGLLGHRDFADYKACPGAHIAWADLGGHGPWEADMPGLRTRPAPGPQTHGTARLAAGIEVIRLEDRARITVPRATVRIATGPFIVEDLQDAPGYFVDISQATCWVRASQAGYTPDPGTDPPTIELRVDGTLVYP